MAHVGDNPLHNLLGHQAALCLLCVSMGSWDMTVRA